MLVIEVERHKDKSKMGYAIVLEGKVKYTKHMTVSKGGEKGSYQEILVCIKDALTYYTKAQSVGLFPNVTRVTLKLYSRNILKWLTGKGELPPKKYREEVENIQKVLDSLQVPTYLIESNEVGYVFGQEEDRKYVGVEKGEV